MLNWITMPLRGANLENFQIIGGVIEKIKTKKIPRKGH